MSPGTNNTGAFLFEKGESMSNINYDKLNDTIVNQAYRYAGLTKDQVAALYEAKIARAQALLEAREQVYHQLED